MPLTVEIVAAMALVLVLACRRPPLRPLTSGAGAAVGLIIMLTARTALHDSGLSGELPPWTLWGWTSVTGFAAAIAVMGWRRASGWWRHGAVFASSFCLLSTGLVVNAWIGYLPTVTIAWDQLTGAPLHPVLDLPAATAMRSRGAQPHDGQLVPIDTGDRASGFRHRTEWVYLPPAWFSGRDSAVSAVLMIGGEFSTTIDWARAGAAITSANEYAKAHDGYAPILVFADANGAFANDTECVNGTRGRAADHLTGDVLPTVANLFRVSANPSRWAVAGFSSGGTCAVDLAAMHPELFSRFVDIAGDERPSAGNPTRTLQRLFAGDQRAQAAFDPATVIAKHGQYADTAGLFMAPASANFDHQVAQRLCSAAALQGIRCSVQVLPGRHTWPFAAAAFETALPWLAASLGTRDPRPD
ncbi:alpha/beta hydrolase-fold protein [Candidatus Mycobacterium wuenschmannii]|uniref:Alpha/beta hydrolase-fold protein n=1 Tax=Candidatus Mycobacterium wuenschmannii TaxID=3027808 RepID=A0ABY8VYE0_9MYCO|nr:alpha/beta hydrolase-fold protein [Candidatus Mycobacterium wuenschmannii]WIM88015.1 alpha/beta hydrolase-fold protein [Candidatus Mycobacterium wuenschmannii]